MIWVALAGGAGALVRSGVDAALGARGPAWRATLAVNLAGSFLLGWASAALPAGWAAVVGTGFCGGLTTFSSACWQSARELGRRRVAWAAAYAAATVVGCLCATWAGVIVGGVVRPG